MLGCSEPADLASLSGDQRMMQSGCNRRSGAAAAAAGLPPPFEGALGGYRGRGLSFGPILASPSRPRRPVARVGVLMKRVSFLFYPSASSTQTPPLLFVPPPPVSHLSPTRADFFSPPIFIPAKTLVIKDAHINESVTFIYI